MDHPREYTEYLSHSEAEKFLMGKFNTDSEEANFWLIHRFPYDRKYGDQVRGESFYDKEHLEQRDFKAECPFKVPHTSDMGSIISGLEAKAILRERKYSKWTINMMLQSIPSYKNKGSHDNRELYRNFNHVAHPEDLFYSKRQVEALIPTPEMLFITFQALKERKHWNRIDENELLDLLIRKHKDEVLAVFDPVHFIPQHSEEESSGLYGDGTQRVDKKPISTGPYGVDAQKLIENKQALFCLAQIIAMEDECFQKEQSKEPVVNQTKAIVQLLFQEELGKIESGAVDKLQRKCIAATILEEGTKRMSWKKPPPEAATIEKLLGELKFKERVDEAYSKRKAMVHINKMPS